MQSRSDGDWAAVAVEILTGENPETINATNGAAFNVLVIESLSSPRWECVKNSFNY
jgi:hypothetical protein